MGLPFPFDAFDKAMRTRALKVRAVGDLLAHRTFSVQEDQTLTGVIYCQCAAGLQV